MKYLSFSLWGDNPMYNIGAIKNAESWKDIYPEWEMVVFYDDTVPTETIEKLDNLGVETIKMDDSIYGCFWRFLAADFDDCEYVIFRDTDSRINLREKFAVDDWINSKKTLHVMRDHPYHKIPAGNDSIGILAGMWGIKGRKFDMETMIENFTENKENFYGIDQTFLKIIYEKFKNDKLEHDDFFQGKPFPSPRDGYRFIGERFDENDNPYDDWKILSMIKK